MTDPTEQAVEAALAVVQQLRGRAYRSGRIPSPLAGQRVRESEEAAEQAIRRAVLVGQAAMACYGWKEPPDYICGMCPSCKARVDAQTPAT